MDKKNIMFKSLDSSDVWFVDNLASQSTHLEITISDWWSEMTTCKFDCGPAIFLWLNSSCCLLNYRVLHIDKKVIDVHLKKKNMTHRLFDK